MYFLDDSDESPYDGYDYHDYDYGYDDDDDVVYLPRPNQRSEDEDEPSDLDELRGKVEDARSSWAEGFRQKRSTVSQAIGLQVDDQQYSDITLQVGQRTFYAHRLILSAWSDVFKTMLCNPSWQANNGETSEEMATNGSHQMLQSNGKGYSQMQELVEEEQCARVFEDFLKFLYTESVVVSDDNVLPLIRLADKYLIPELRELCEAFFNDHQNDVEAALVLLRTASEMHMPTVVETCHRVLRTNFNSLSEEQLMTVDSDNLISLLDSGPSLVILDEYSLFEKLQPWLAQCHDEAVFMKVFSLIRFPYMNALQLKKATTTPEFSRASVLSPDLLIKVWQAHTLYTEGYDEELPDDFPWPRLYLGSISDPALARLHERSRLDVRDNFVEIQVNDSTERVGSVMKGQYVMDNIIFRRENSLHTCMWKVSVKTAMESTRHLIVHLSLVRNVSELKYKVAVEAKVSSEQSQYFSTSGTFKPSDEILRMYGHGSVEVAQFKMVSMQDKPQKVKVRITTVIEPKPKAEQVAPIPPKLEAEMADEESKDDDSEDDISIC